ncbi:putative membrane protein YuiD, partial [Tanacetum coccineum]
VLNLIVEDLFQGHPISKRKLKELLGHTPSQVVAGAVLGILVAFFCCQAGIEKFDQPKTSAQIYSQSLANYYALQKMLRRSSAEQYGMRKKNAMIAV